MQSVLNLFSPVDFSDTEYKHRANILRRIVLLSLTGSLVFGITSYVLKWGGIIPIASAIYALLALGCLRLIRQGKLDIPGILLPLILLALVTYQTIRNHGPHDQAILIYPLVITFAWLLLSRRMAQLFILLSLASAFLVIYLDVNGLITPHVEGSSEYFDIITFGVVLGSISFLVDSVMDNLRGVIKRLQKSESDLRLQAEVLAQREAEIRMFIEEAPNGICILNVQRRIELINSRVCEMLGYTSEEMLGHNAEEFISPEELARLPIITGPELVQMRFAREERLLTRKNGSVIWVLGSIRLLPDGRFQYTLQDITEQKQLEQRLRESEEHYRRFIALSSEAIWRMDFQPPIPTDLPKDEIVAKVLQAGILIECNDSYARLYGHTSSTEIAGKLWSSIPPEVPQADLEILEQFVESKFRLENAESFSDDEGYPQYFLSNMIGILEDGELIHAWGTVQDITERKLAEAAIAESEKRYRGAIISAGLVPYEIDYRERRFTFIGEDIYKLTGYSSDEITPKLLKESLQEDYIWGPNAKLTPDEARELFLAGAIQVWRSDMRIRTRTGESRWLSDTSIEISDEAGKVKGAIGIFQDITERKRIETERENLIAELEKRNAELERFNYTLSHELKTPLVTIRGFLGYLEESVTKNNMARARSDIDRIAKATDKMHSMINELLELSRVGRVKNPPQDIPFEMIVREGLQAVEGQIIQRNVKVVIDQQLPTVHVDRPRFVEVIQNLVDNAIKYMGHQTEPAIHIGVKSENEEQVFFVQDNGMGIDPAYHERVFGLFDKLDPLSDGTGIGLALVKRIITFHGGRIWIESEGLGKGTTFCFTVSNVK